MSEQQQDSGNNNVIVKKMTLEEIEKRKQQLIDQDKLRRKAEKAAQEDNPHTDKPDNWAKDIQKSMDGNKKKRKRGGCKRKPLDKEKRKEVNKIKKERQKIKQALERQLQAMGEGGEKKEYNDEQQADLREKKMNKKQFKEIYKQKMENAPTVVVDFQFVDQIMEKDRKSLMKQVELAHGLNMKSDNPLKLTVSSAFWHDHIKELVKNRSAENWGIQFEEEHILKKFKKSDLVYMSGDVDVDLDEYDPTKVYIIGGLVEHNRLTNLTKDYCEKHGIAARRLPLARYINLKACSLLNIDHVFNILLKLHNGKSMEYAVQTSVPQRKIGDVYDLTSSSDNENEKEEEENKNEQEE